MYCTAPNYRNVTCRIKSRWCKQTQFMGLGSPWCYGYLVVISPGAESCRSKGNFVLKKINFPKDSVLSTFPSSALLLYSPRIKCQLGRWYSPVSQSSILFSHTLPPTRPHHIPFSSPPSPSQPDMNSLKGTLVLTILKVQTLDFHRKTRNLCKST